MRVVRRRVRRDTEVAGDGRDGIVEEIWEERPPIPPQVAMGPDPVAVGVAISVILGLVTLGLLIALLVTPNSFGIASEENVRDAARNASAPGARGPAGPRGAQGVPGPASAADDARLDTLGNDIASVRQSAEATEQRVADLRADIAGLCAAQPSAC